MNGKYITPAVTVFHENGTVDYEACGRVYEHLIAGGVDGILILGSIGEFFAVKMDQKKELIRRAVETIGKRVKLIVGTTSMIFDEIIELSRFAGEAGADAVMVLPPFYFPLNEESMFQYFGKIAESLPKQQIYLYNFPDRTGYDVTPGVTLRLAGRYPNIVGYKDTQAGMDHTRELIKLVKGARPDFEIYSGFDDNFAHNVLTGGNGCIGGLSNLVPELCHAWTEAVNGGDLEKTARIQRTIDRLMSVYQVGTPFVPFIKAAMELRGVPTRGLASFPFPVVSEEEKGRIRRILLENGIL